MNKHTPVTTEFRPHVAIINGEIKTTSTDVAEHFGKRHDDVLKRIKSLDCSPDFYARNFAEIQIDIDLGMGRTRKSPAFEMTKDGFFFLAMGFTGKQAAQWKEAYIAAFNAMAEQLSTQQLPEPKTKKALPHGLTLEQQDTIKQLVKDRVAELPKNKQAKAAITCWSAIKSKYGKTYKQVEPEHFTGIVSLLARLPLEGELLAAEPNPPANTLSIDLDNLGSAGVNRVFVQFKHAGLSHGRWLVTLNDNALCIQQMERDEFIATGPRLAALIGDSMGRAVDRQHLPAIIEAAAKRLNNSQQRTQ